MSEKAELRRSILALIVFAVAIVLFSLLKTGFKTEIQRDVHLDIYENGAVVGQTVVHIDGTRAELLLGKLIEQEDNFAGRFAVELAERTCSEHTSVRILWHEYDYGLTYQTISFWHAGDIFADGFGIEHVLLINPDMTEMAIQMTDGRVLASSQKVYDIYMEHFEYHIENGSTGIVGVVPEF